MFCKIVFLSFVKIRWADLCRPSYLFTYHYSVFPYASFCPEEFYKTRPSRLKVFASVIKTSTTLPIISGFPLKLTSLKLSVLPP